MKAKISVLTCYFLLITILIVFSVIRLNTATTIDDLARFLSIYAVAMVILIGLFLLIDSVIRLNNVMSYLSTRSLPNIILITIFLLTMLLPLIGLALGVEERFPNFENRNLAGKPKLGINTLASFPNNLKAYFNDKFGFRKTLIHLNSVARVRYFNVSSVSDVILGKNDWLYYAPNLKDYQCSLPLTEEQLQSICQNIKEQRDWLGEKGTYYLIVVVPNKETIYPEYLPATVRRFSQETRLDQLKQYLESHSDMQIIDLRDALSVAKTKYPVYYHTDPHWNNYGAFVGYCEILKRLSTCFPDLKPISDSDFNVVLQSTLGNGSLAGVLGMPGIFAEEKTQVVLDDNAFVGQEKLKSALVFYDSFFDFGVSSYISANFENIIRAEYMQKFDYGLIESEKPEVVIYIMCEHNIAYFLLP